MVEGVIKQYELTRTHDVVEDIIASNVSDPLTGAFKRAETSHWIFDGKPNKADVGKPAPKGWKYPIIVINYPELEIENKNVSGTIQQHIHIVPLMCYGTSREQVALLAEQCNYILNGSTGQTSLRTGNLNGPFMADSVQDVDFVGGHKEYMKGFEFEFRRMD